MKALLIKDWKILIRCLKLYFFILLCYAPLGALGKDIGFAQIFPIFLGAVLPVSTLGYDERAHWDPYAVTLPLSRKDIVLSKYVMGLAITAAVAIYTLAANLLIPAVILRTAVSVPALAASILLFAAIAIIFMDINLPFMYLLGTEKGRLVYMASLVLVIVISGLLPEISHSALGLSLDTARLSLAMTAAAIPLTAGSAALSLCIYRKKELAA